MLIWDLTFIRGNTVRLKYGKTDVYKRKYGKTDVYKRKYGKTEDAQYN